MIQNPLGEGPSFRLPVDAYLDEKWLERELDVVFARHWSLVAAVEELPLVGDVLDVSVGRFELVIIRVESGWRAFHNTCRHRGMALACGPAHTDGNLRCPYHGWEFAGADGALVRLPQRGSQFATDDVRALGLRTASVAEWEGMLFVHPDPDAETFDSSIAEFAAGIGSFRPGQLQQVAREQIAGAFNWKLFVENHVDVYHLWYLHDRTLADFDHTRFEHREIGANWVSYEPMRPQAQPASVRPIEHLSTRDRDGIGAHLLFPNMTMATTADYFITYAVFPDGPTHSHVDLRVRAEDPSRAAELIAAARSFIDEDVVACERIQQAMASPSFEVGPLARTHERPITRFHDELLARLDATAVGLPARRAVVA